MDIKDIENNLNNFEADRDKVISQILNITVQNQAMIRTLIDCQLSLMTLLSSNSDPIVLADNLKETIEVYEAQIRAFLTAQF